MTMFHVARWAGLLLLAGCASQPLAIAPGQVPMPDKVKIVRKEGRAVTVTGFQLTADSATGQSDSTRVAIATADVKRFETVQPQKTQLAVLGVLAGLVVAGVVIGAGN